MSSSSYAFKYDDQDTNKKLSKFIRDSIQIIEMKTSTSFSTDNITHKGFYFFSIDFKLQTELFHLIGSILLESKLIWYTKRPYEGIE